MTEEGPFDLKVLDPGEPPDLASKAVRRFRLHVVLFTVVCVVVASIAVGAVVAWAIKDRPQTEAIGWSPAQTAILNDFIGICRSPTFTFGELEIGLAGAVRMEDDGYALHFLLHGLVSVQRETDDGGSSMQTTSIIATEGDGARPGLAQVQPGLTWGDLYVATPPGGDERIELLIQGPSFEEPQTFTVDLTGIWAPC